MTSTTPSVSDEELTSLMHAVKKRYDLDFTNYERTSLKRGIVRLMMKHGLETMFELWAKVLKDRDFFMSTIDDLLVNLTELFRNPDVWVMIRDNLLNEFPHRSPKIWHAGCSTGEEVYTMAIVLDEKNMLYQARTLATDLSTKALEKARKGQYPLQVIKQYLKPFLEFFPNRKMEDFFEFNGTHASIKPQYQQHVTYKKHNLVHDPAEGKYDIIFCRNVMIYFDEWLKGKVLKLFFDNLNPGGYLVIGYYDIMPDLGKEMFETYDIKTRIYKKNNSFDRDLDLSEIRLSNLAGISA